MSLRDLFGGGSNSRSQETTSTYTPVQAEQIQNFLPQAESFFTQGTPDVSAGTAMQGDAAQAYLDAAANLSGNLGGVQGAQQQLFAAGDPSSNPAFQQYLQFINDETLRATERLLPRLAVQGVQGGTLGSSKEAQMRQLLGQEAQRQIAGNTAGAINTAYGQGLDAIARGINLNPNIINAAGAPGNYISSAAGQQFGADTAQYNLDQSAIQQYADLLAQNYGGTTRQATPVETGGLAGALGGAATGLGLASSIPGAQAYAPWLAGGGAVLGLLS